MLESFTWGKVRVVKSQWDSQVSLRPVRSCRFQWFSWFFRFFSVWFWWEPAWILLFYGVGYGAASTTSEYGKIQSEYCFHDPVWLSEAGIIDLGIKPDSIKAEKIPFVFNGILVKNGIHQSFAKFGSGSDSNRYQPSPRTKTESSRV